MAANLGVIISFDSCFSVSSMSSGGAINEPGLTQQCVTPAGLIPSVTWLRLRAGAV